MAPTTFVTPFAGTHRNALTPNFPACRPLISLALAATLLASPLAATASTGDDEPIPVAEWIDQSLRIDELEGAKPEYLESMRTHLGRYAAWVRDNDYFVDRSADARVILVTRSEKISAKRMKLVEEALEAFDELLQPPDRSTSDETFHPGGAGVGDHIPDAEPIVLIEVDGGSPYAQLMTSLDDEDPSLSGWARAQAGQPGCAEGRFALAAWQHAPEGYEFDQVWRPQNELVNRLARLAVHRSFGPQPTWLSISCAWLVEMDVLDSIYCFPYRSEFVGIGEHEGWKSEVKGAFKKRKKEPLQMAEFAEWQRNTWDIDQAAKAWAFAEYIRAANPGALGACAEEFRKLYKAGHRTTYPDGRWETNPNFQLTAEDQQAVFQEKCGETLLADATKFFRTWKKPRVKNASSKRKRR